MLAASQKLPRFSNQEFDQVEALASELHINLNACPTCRAKPVEVAPGVMDWADSTYRLYQQDRPCSCEYQNNLQRHYLLSQIPRTYWTLGENEFFGDPEALRATQSYLDNWDGFKHVGGGMEFYSASQGTGKTMLACLIGKELIKRGESVHFVYFRDIMSLYDKPFEIRDAEVRRLRRTSVLILDEVCLTISDAQHKYFAGEFEDLIRFRTSGNGVTIMTTNLTPEELEIEYPRTYSLLAAKQQRIKVAGVDARIAGDVDFMNMELALNGEARPLQ